MTDKTISGTDSRDYVRRMSATDELRRLLDERGVEWIDHEAPAADCMAFCDGNDWHDCWDGVGGKVNVVFAMSPEQAIAATLGRGTCHVVSAEKLGDSFGFKMSCGHSMVNPFNIQPDYCPWCGAKVVV